MAGKKRFRVFATSRIGEAAEGRLRERDYDLEVYEGPEAPPKKLIIEKVKSGIDGLITTLRDPIDAEVFEAGRAVVPRADRTNFDAGQRCHALQRASECHRPRSRPIAPHFFDQKSIHLDGEPDPLRRAPRRPHGTSGLDRLGHVDDREVDPELLGV